MLTGMVLAKWHELGVRPGPTTENFFLHCKDIPKADREALLNLYAHDETIVQDLKKLYAWLDDPRLYESARSTELERSSIPMKDTQLQLKRGKIRPQPAPKGTCRMFRVPEHAKGRFRAIQHPVLANKTTAKDMKVKFTTFHERHGAVLKGKYAIDLDWSAFFDQFELSEEVSEYFSFIAKDGKVYSMRVLPMGLKHSVSIAHKSTLQLLNFGPKCYVEAYIDNVRLISDDKQQLIMDAATLVARCARAGVTVNEVDVSALRACATDEEAVAMAMKVGRHQRCMAGRNVRLREEADRPSGQDARQG